MKKEASYILVLLIVCSCTLLPTIPSKPYWIKERPPGTFAVNESLYCDEEEISNLSWLEYLHWLKRVHGSSSSEYLTALPDTTIWLKMDSCLHPLSKRYLRAKIYHHVPVVGLSKDQIVAYSQWRTDRVFEGLLIRHKVIPHLFDQGPSNYFSVERYFKGSFEGIDPHPDFTYVPNYRLTEPNELEVVLSVLPKEGIWSKTEILNASPCAHLNGELTLLLQSDSLHLATYSFRNVCTWEKYEED